MIDDDDKTGRNLYDLLSKWGWGIFLICLVLAEAYEKHCK